MFGKKNKENRSFKIFFASDFHGSTIVFKKFLNAVKIYNANALIFGGDITGKAIIPIVKNSDGTYVTNLFGQTKILKNQEELNQFITLQENTGYYPKIMDRDLYDELSNNEKLKLEIFRELMIERVKKWISIANERLSPQGIKLYLEAGNDDFLGIEENFDSEMTVNIGEKVVDVNGYKLLGMSMANVTPWHAPRDVEESKLNEIIDNEISEVDANDRLIFAYHPPPINTNLDLAPQITENLTYVSAGGQQIMVHVGSRAVRDAIERIQPIVSLHGHIHESRGIDRIGKTLCVNPGSEYTEGILHAALVVLNDREVLNQILITG